MKDVESENYNKIREFFTTESDAFLVSAALVYFGTQTVNDMPTKNVFQPSLHQSNVEEKRKWLHEHAGKLFDLFVSDSIAELGDAQEAIGNQQEREVLPCRFAGCTRVFQYSKCRVNHETSKHSLLLNDVTGSTASSEPAPQQFAAIPDQSECPHIPIGKGKGEVCLEPSG